MLSMGVDVVPIRGHSHSTPAGAEELGARAEADPFTRSARW